ncbi:3'-5' exoribonuclease YhaM family protein [Gehongia tenuis]|uniref:HD domain-containing protein n=1 Tax=Gehongia tenuis TaxID=2763655 RepID=A0A926HQR9_9FIRM|nr:OB-fold nucleic acid binding domain-containing protein [Gehongia tenuis]MBC8531531.1 HD domain-containing protein [Gehongia tenuis]
MKQEALKNLKDGARFTGFVLVRQWQKKTAKNGSSYVDMVVGDRTANLPAKIWDAKPADEVAAGEVIKVRGAVQAYKGQPQIIVELWRKPSEQDQKEYDLEELVPTAPVEAGKMFAEMKAYCARIGDEDLRALAGELIEEHKDKLMYFPAAMKGHHALRGGLLYHTTTMLHAAEAMLGIYSFLNADLLYAGVLVHDLAKMEEMDADETGSVGAYTVRGTLLGHINDMVAQIALAAERVHARQEAVTMLQHMVLAHHYEPEYGSPKRPLFPEAELLHHLDMIDARMYDMHRALEGAEPGGFSERLWSMQNRQLYRSPDFYREEEENR